MRPVWSRLDEDTISLRTLRQGWLKQHLARHPDALQHYTAGPDDILITATTEELQAFLLAHVNDQEAMTDAAPYRRAKVGAAPTTVPAAFRN